MPRSQILALSTSSDRPFDVSWASMRPAIRQNSPERYSGEDERTLAECAQQVEDAMNRVIKLTSENLGEEMEKAIKQIYETETVLRATSWGATYQLTDCVLLFRDRYDHARSHHREASTGERKEAYQVLLDKAKIWDETRSLDAVRVAGEGRSGETEY